MCYFLIPLSLSLFRSLYGISVVLAAKLSDDVYYCNQFYSDVCQMDLKTFNYLEQSFAWLLGFEFFVSAYEFLHLRQSHDKVQLEILQRENSNAFESLISSIASCSRGTRIAPKDCGDNGNQRRISAVQMLQS